MVSTTDSTPRTAPEPSSWSFSEKCWRTLWMLAGKPLFRCTFHNWYALRAALLRLFGAKIGRSTRIRPSVNIEIPWMCEIQDEATVGDFVILYSLGKITVGKRTVVSQYAHLCAGTHDYTDPAFPLVRSPITIGDDVWICADVFVGPGVTVGNLAVVGARSNVFHDLPAGKICAGSPAKPMKDRELKTSNERAAE